MRPLAYGLLLLTVGCAFVQSDKAWLANAAAERIYLSDRYVARCVTVVGPPACKQWGEDLNRLLDAERTANEVLKVGRVPAAEKAEINALLKKARNGPN